MYGETNSNRDEPWSAAGDVAAWTSHVGYEIGACRVLVERMFPPERTHAPVQGGGTSAGSRNGGLVTRVAGVGVVARAISMGERIGFERKHRQVDIPIKLSL